ncbi:MAG: HTH-type transcriptional regulator GntR [Candidatus Celerinatantimonas neptuna]|nr:MAG: HTH-type transcriptional regulator GntR [Candidatus Celerinatantimonas neptuna]
MAEKKVNRKKSVTLADIAKIVGVGNMTVSRALRTPDKVSDSVRQKIESVARELGYPIPVHVDSAKKMGIILIHSMDYFAYHELFLWIKKLFNKSGIDFLIDSSIMNGHDEYNKLILLSMMNPSFVILSSAPHLGDTVSLLKSMNVPVIEILSETPDPIDINIGISQQNTLYNLTEKHIGYGYSDICFVCEDQNNWKIKQQVIGWQRAMITHGLNPNQTLDLPDSFSYGKASGLIPEILLRWPMTQLVLCGNIQIANALICECFRRSIKIPEVLSIASVGSQDLAQNLYPSLSCADIPLKELAEEIYSVVKRCIRGHLIEQKIIIKDSLIKLRGSSCSGKRDNLRQNDWI